MAYVSLYRKYRPQTFEDVVGQEHVTQTLRNAIKEGRLASGYLFCGTRGTAKTTCARILAKALNCIGPNGDLTSPTPDPCGVCGPCQAIAASSFVDVLEMDAASHGKVDDVRDLVASIKFPPMEGRYKVYIIDEAHQLSRDAMDAFLKTLEEPPDRVLFVLATTEEDKLPITIRSRCQVFEFKRGSVSQIASRVSKVLKDEGIQAAPEAITLVARGADGSYRDSLSLLEQVLAYKRQNLTAADVTVVLGTVDDDLLSHVVSLIASGDAAGAFQIAGDILESGKDVRQFLKSLSQRFRDLLFVGVGAQAASEGDISDSAALAREAALFSPAALMQALETLTEAERETRWNNQHRLLLEMALLRLMRLPQSANVAEPIPAIRMAVPSLLGKGEDRPLAPNSGGTGEEKGAATSAPTSGSPELGQGGDPVDDLPPPLAPDEEETLDEIESNALLPGDDLLDMLILDDPAPPELGAGGAFSEEHDDRDDLLQVQQVAAAEPTVSTLPIPVPAADAPPELLRLQKSWQQVINLIGSRSPSGVQDVKDAKPIALNDRTILLEFSQQFHFDRVQGKERGRKMVEDFINQTLGESLGTYKIKCILRGSDAGGKLPLKTAPKMPAAPEANGSAHSPWVDEVIAVFGGRVLDEDAKG